MAMSAEHLRRDALTLSTAERADLAAELLASLDEPTDGDVELVNGIWAKEIERRARAVIAGNSPTESWETVRQRIADDLVN